MTGLFMLNADMSARRRRELAFRADPCNVCWIYLACWCFGVGEYTGRYRIFRESVHVSAALVPWIWCT